MATGSGPEVALRLAVEDVLAGDATGPDPTVLATCLVRLAVLDPGVATTVLDGWEDGRSLRQRGAGRGLGHRSLWRHLSSPPAPATGPPVLEAVALTGDLRSGSTAIEAHGLVWVDDATVLVVTAQALRRRPPRPRTGPPAAEPVDTRFAGLHLRTGAGTEHDLEPRLESTERGGLGSVVQLRVVPPLPHPPGPVALTARSVDAPLLADPSGLAAVVATGVEEPGPLPGRVSRLLRQQVEQAAAAGYDEAPGDLVTLAAALGAAGLPGAAVPPVPSLTRPTVHQQATVAAIGRSLPLVDGFGVGLVALERHQAGWCLRVHVTGDGGAGDGLVALHWRATADDDTLHVGRARWADETADRADLLVVFAPALAADVRHLHLEVEGPRTTAWAAVELP